MEVTTADLFREPLNMKVRVDCFMYTVMKKRSWQHLLK